MFLAHKITYSKWRKFLNASVNQIPADSITADLRTSGNTLSFWYCGGDQVTRANLEQASLAMATEFEKSNKVDLIWLSKESLEQGGYQVRQTDGQTQIPELVSLHYDVCNIDYQLLGDMARRIQEAIRNGNLCQLRRAEVLNVLVKAAKDGRFDFAKLKPKLRSEVESRLAT